MKSFFNVTNIIILLLLTLLILSRIESCNNDEKVKIIRVEGKPYQVIKYEIDTVERIQKIFIEKPGKDIYYEKIVYVRIPISIDTIEIINNYFTQKIYKDTIKLKDSLGFVFIQDTVTENKIAHRIFKADIKERIVNKEIYLKELPKSQFYYGIEGISDKTDLFKGIGGGLLYKTKSDQIYKLNLGLMNNLNGVNPYLNFGMYWKIKLKK